jgi:hypothetical protein
MLPIECRIPYSAETQQRLLGVCVPMMRELGAAAERNPEGDDWNLGSVARPAASAIKIAEWVRWTFSGFTGIDQRVIVAPPGELLAALDHMETFIDRRLHALGVKQACGDARGSVAVKVIVAVPVEHVEEVQRLVEARTVCEQLRREVDAQVALWTLDREQRDQLRPQVVAELTFFAEQLRSTLADADWLLARDHGETCADLIEALDRLDWDADDPQVETFGVPPESVLGLLAETRSPIAEQLLATLDSSEEV